MTRRSIETISLPKNVHKKKNSYFYVTWNGETKKRTWHPLGTDLDLALTKYEAIQNFRNKLPRFKEYKHHFDYLLKKTRQSALNRKIEHSITIDDVERIWKRSQGMCEVTSVPLTYEFDGDLPRGFFPWGPSIDRVDSQIGYTPDNIRMVCLAANVAMNKWGEDVLRTMMLHMVRRNKRSTKFYNASCL